MSAIPTATPARPLLRHTFAAALPAFALALFSSALLLFWVEPLFARMLLPRLGGSQGVWNTCLVFFQAMLLLGYTYAHALARWLPLKRQILVHLLVFAIGALFLPVTQAAGWTPPSDASPVFPVFMLLTVSLGAPFFALSANAPLLQHWFSLTTHRHAHNPYFLYAASNAGSLLALAAYPFLLEPNATLGQQAVLWAFGYAGLAALVACTGAVALALPKSAAEAPEAASFADGAISWSMRLRWLIYAALPSSLLLGVTGYVTTDIASFPLIWLVPLALYLLTFIVVFAHRPPLNHSRMVKALPFAIMVTATAFWLNRSDLGLALTAQFGAFFFVAVACHGELARLRPPASQLTRFYFWMSLGGVVGGAATQLVAPLVFKEIVEYPLMLAVVCLLRPGETGSSAVTRERVYETALLLAAIVIVLLNPSAFFGPRVSESVSIFAIVMVFAFALRPLFSRQRVHLLLVALGVLLASEAALIFFARNGSIVYRARSFYGAYIVTDDATSGYRAILHGTTLHGVERLDLSGKAEPLSYFSKQGPLGNIMGALGPQSQNVGLIGLGIGSTTCYARPDQAWTIYEIDPLVYDIAAKSGLFHTLTGCAPQAKLVLGDGRLNIENAPAAQYDLFIVDAFSSDSIPIHLMTREAFHTYMRSLKPHGVLAVHITNRHLELAPIVARIAPEAGFVAYDYNFRPVIDGTVLLHSPTHWMVLARSESDLGELAANPHWRRMDANAGTALWTDDFSNILSALK